MLIERLVLGQLDTNCWLAADAEGGPLLVIDPAGDAAVLLDAIAGRSVSVVVLTHGHFDHLGAATAVCTATGAPLAVHRLDAAVVTDSWANGGGMFGFEHVGPAPDRLLEDGDTVQAGALTLGVLHTPGHTPGCICLYAADALDPHLFSGDTLFRGSVGRSDLPGGDGRELSRSIERQLSVLPVATKVHPGHGPDTTIAYEARVNPFWPRGR